MILVKYKVRSHIYRRVQSQFQRQIDWPVWQQVREQLWDQVDQPVDQQVKNNLKV